MTIADPTTEDFFEAAFNAAPFSILVFDDDGRYLHANAMAASIFGASVEEILKKRLGEFTHDRHRAAVDGLWSALRENGTAKGTHRIHAADGVERGISYEARAAFLPGRNIIVSCEVPLGGQRLSPREREVIGMLAVGANGSRIAEELGISPETVRTHIRNAMEKLQARTRPHAVALAAGRGEIELEALA